MSARKCSVFEMTLCSYQWESEYGHIEVCLLDEDEHEIVEEHEFQEHE